MAARSWPLPALLAWAACWAAFLALGAVAAPAPLAVALAASFGGVIALSARTPWRRVFIVAGFPLSLAVSGAITLPAWAWLGFLAAVAWVYPVSAWRDAPVFPTRRGALRGLAKKLSLPERAKVLDAGCGLGDALLELRRELPGALCTGIERSGPLAAATALRCRFATIRRGDMWATDWSGFDLVYLFQRPESMARAAAKAGEELAPGAWLASFEFEASTLVPEQVLATADGRCVWLYRVPFNPACRRDAAG